MNAASTERDSARNQSITIRLHYQWDGRWHLTHAQHWNERGFYFFAEQALPLGYLHFKRSLLTFSGELIWAQARKDEEQVLEMLVNQQIYRYAQTLQDRPETQSRLIQLMRTHGLVADKQRVLATLGGNVTEQQWQQRVNERMKEPLFQFGVRVHSTVWTAVVQEAQSLSGVLQDLENWQQTAFGNLSDR